MDAATYKSAEKLGGVGRDFELGNLAVKSHPSRGVVAGAAGAKQTKGGKPRVIKLRKKNQDLAAMTNLPRYNSGKER